MANIENFTKSGKSIRSKNALSEILNCFTLFRLQYFARGVQIYIKQLRAALQGKTGDALKTEEVRDDFTVQFQ